MLVKKTLQFEFKDGNFGIAYIQAFNSKQIKRFLFYTFHIYHI